MSKRWPKQLNVHEFDARGNPVVYLHPCPQCRIYVLAPQPKRRKPSKTRAGSDVTQGWDDRHSLLDDDEPIARKRRKPARRGGAK